MDRNKKEIRIGTIIISIAWVIFIIRFISMCIIASKAGIWPENTIYNLFIWILASTFFTVIGIIINVTQRRIERRNMKANNEELAATNVSKNSTSIDFIPDETIESIKPAPSNKKDGLLVHIKWSHLIYASIIIVLVVAMIIICITVSDTSYTAGLEAGLKGNPDYKTEIFSSKDVKNSYESGFKAGYEAGSERNS